MSKRLTHHAIVAQGNRRNQPIPPDIQCLIREGIVSNSESLDRTGTVTTANTNITYDVNELFEGLPVLSFSGTQWADIPININSFNGTIEATFKINQLPINATIWSSSNDGVGNFAYGLFVLSHGAIRVHNCGTMYDIDEYPIPIGKWFNVITTFTTNKILVEVFHANHLWFKKEWTRQLADGTSYVRLGQHSKFNQGISDAGLRGWISKFKLSGTY